MGCPGKIEVQVSHAPLTWGMTLITCPTGPCHGFLYSKGVIKTYKKAYQFLIDSYHALKIEDDLSDR